VRIDPRNLPVDAQIGRTEEQVVVAEKSGVNLDFGVRMQTQSAMVILHDRNGKFLPAGLKGNQEGASEPFIVGYDGQAYLRDLDSSNTVVIELPDGAECRASFDYAPDPGRQVVVGPVRCL
jgi:outer membrane usher protein